VSLTTYTELKASIADWLLRDDLTAVIPDFITLAEAQINRQVRDHRMVKRSDASLATAYTTFPSDWQETIRFQLSTSPIVVLEFLTPNQASDAVSRFSSTGKPVYFSTIGESVELIPSPDSTYTTELTYYGKIPALSATNASNWLLIDAPDIYLYGALLQAAPYLNEDQRIGTWQSLYSKGVEEMKIMDQRARIGSSSIRMRPSAMA
jgi:hypothetical protein|tara:strand:+ start:1018 stop:1638 length:621 start_codon:yes stop_codon:yes gene_type:complete